MIKIELISPGLAIGGSTGGAASVNVCGVGQFAVSSLMQKSIGCYPNTAYSIGIVSKVILYNSYPLNSCSLIKA